MPQSRTTPNGDRSYTLPELGSNPSSARQGTTPGSFALPPRVGTAHAFSSPDTPGMPEVSAYTAMDFRDAARDRAHTTQLECARDGVITPEMRRVAQREEERRFGVELVADRFAVDGHAGHRR